MAMTSGNFGKLLAFGLDKIFFDHWKQWPEEFSKVFEVGPMGKPGYVKDLTVSGFAAMPVKNEGHDITYFNALQGYETTYRAVTYGMGFTVTRELWDDSLYGIIQKFPKALQKSARHTVEITCANILNRAFNASYTGGDGKELCATDHPLLGGGTEQNELTTPADLAASSLNEARYVMEETVDDQGLLNMIKPKRLIVPPEEEYTARELLESQYKVASNYGHVKNVMQDFGLNLIVMHYLTDADAWFIQSEDHAMRFLWRDKLEFGQDSAFSSENALFKARMRFDVSWSDFRGFFGTAGAD